LVKIYQCKLCCWFLFKGTKTDSKRWKLGYFKFKNFI